MKTTYKVSITDMNTAEPLAIVRKNNTGVTFNWTRNGTGIIKGTPSEPLNIDNCILSGSNLGLTIGDFPDFIQYFISEGNIFINTFRNGNFENPHDECLFKYCLKLEIYQ
jgi:hypothetical protein